MLLTALTLLAQVNFGKGLEPDRKFAPFFPESNDAAGDGALTSLENMISMIIGITTVLGGIFFVVFFILGAFKWVSAGGDSGKVQKARDQMIQGVVGLILLVAAYAIIGLIGTVIGINLLTPKASLETIRGSFF